MALGPLNLNLISLLFFFPASLLAAGAQASVCFDLTKPNLRLLRPAPTAFPEIGKETESFGKDEKSGLDWASAAGRVNKPVPMILDALLDPMTTRDRDTTTVQVERTQVKGAIQKQHIKVKVKPFFLLTLEWEEEWLYTPKKGRPGKPESVVISYQKTAGTSHIEHFCGNILIQKLTPSVSAVYLTEEIKADRRSAEDAYRGLMGTLRTLRE